MLISICITEQDKIMYTTKYDHIDIDAIIKSNRLLANYVDCLMDEKTCTPEGAELKRNLPDALATDCASCSDTQKSMADKIYHHLIDNRINDWLRLEEKYDPSGNYRAKYIEKRIKLDDCKLIEMLKYMENFIFKLQFTTHRIIHAIIDVMTVSITV